MQQNFVQEIEETLNGMEEFWGADGVSEAWEQFRDALIAENQEEELTLESLEDEQEDLYYEDSPDSSVSGASTDGPATKRARTNDSTHS